MTTQRFLLIALCLSAGGCLIPSVSVTPAVSVTEVEGSVAASTSSGGGSASASTSFNELGLDDSSTGFAPRVDLNWIGFRISLSTLATSIEGSGTAETLLEFDDVVINPGDDVDSSFDLNTFSAAGTWDFIPGDALEIGLGLGVTLFDFDIEFDPQDDALDSASSDESVPLPVLVARVGSKIGPFDLAAVLGFSDLEVDDVDASFYDFDVYAGYRLLGDGDRFVGHIVGGYRAVDMDAEYDDGDSVVDMDFKVTGPYLGVMFSF